MTDAPAPPPPGRLIRFASRISASAPVRRLIGPQLIARADRALLARSGGRRSLTALSGAMPMLLTTTGCRSGEPRSVALVGVPDGADLVVVASNWGREHHPAWSANLLADPHAEVVTRDERYAVRARLCDDAERARRWPYLIAAIPAWDRYRTLTPRSLRVFVLERAHDWEASP